MWKKTILPIIIFLCIAYAGYSLDLCPDTIEINTNCSMVTPSLNCTVYHYWIYDNQSNTVANASLTQFTSNIYYFNFTQGVGEYVIQLCDDTTRQVIIKATEGGKPVLAVVVLLPLALCFILLFISSQLDPREHTGIKLFLNLLSIPAFVVSLNFAVMALARYYDFEDLIEAIGKFNYWLIWVFVVLLFYFLIWIFIKAVRQAAQKKGGYK